jgi:hypothetical protein
MIDKKLRPECLAEMNEVRQSLMSDYRINPEIIANCEEEIKICRPPVLLLHLKIFNRFSHRKQLQKTSLYNIIRNDISN